MLAGYRRILSTLECDPDGRSILPLHGLHLLEALTRWTHGSGETVSVVVRRTSNDDMCNQL